MNNRQEQGTILGVAAHSGGHIIPVITMMEREGRPWHLITGNAAIDQRVIAGRALAAQQYTMVSIDPIAWRRPWRWPITAWQLLTITGKSIQIIRQLQPTLLISSGGLLSIPVCFAAYLCRLPIQLWILDALPGGAARVIMPLATEIYIVFAATKKFCPAKKTKQQAYPLVPELHALPNREVARQQLALDPDKPTLLILGGSQGSRQLNELLVNTVTRYAQEYRERLQIFHQTGNNAQEISARYRELGIRAIVVDYQANMAPVYGAATMAIARAGAGTIAELVDHTIPTLFIPLLATTTAHQRDNAQAIAAEKPSLCQWLDPRTVTIQEVNAFILAQLLKA